jgi:hypothetical protein
VQSHRPSASAEILNANPHPRAFPYLRTRSLTISPLSQTFHGAPFSSSPIFYGFCKKW